MSKITIKLNEELEFITPTVPQRSTMINYGKHKKDQYWTRPNDLPKQFWDWNEDVNINADKTEYDEGILISLSIEDTILVWKFREREMDRRQNGVWILINGEPFYLTGDFYFFLMYCYMPGTGYPDFRKFQLKIFYVIFLTIQNPDILGVYFQKAKKTGLTQIIVSVFLNHSTMTKERTFGFMNKTGPEAETLNMSLFNASYEKLPAIMTPKITTKSESRIIFGKPPVKYTGTKGSIQKLAKSRQLKVLNTWIITAAPVKEPKFDGPKMYFIQLDEFPKYKVSPKAIFEKVSETVKMQQTIVGKIFITSYPPEIDTPSFEEAKVIYYESKLSTIKDKTTWNRTQSGLICYYVSSLESTDGTFDKYGNADEELAMRRNQAERDGCKTTGALQAKIRQYSRTEEESWRTGGSGSTFNNIRLGDGKATWEKAEKTGELLKTNVFLHWTNGRFTKVTYEPLTDEEIKEKKLKEYLEVYEMPAEQDLNRVFKDNDEYWTPVSDTKYLFSMDPSDYIHKSAVKSDPSDNAIYVTSHFDIKRDTMMGRPASKVPVARWVWRPEDPNDAFEFLLKLMFFFGAFGIIEGNKPWVLTKLKELGLWNFMLVLMKDGTIQPFKYGEENMAGSSISTSTTLINTLCRYGNSYLKKPQMEGDVDYCMNLKVIMLYDSLMKFNPRNTQPSHDAMAWLYLLLALECFNVIQHLLFNQDASNDAMAEFGNYLSEEAF